MITAGVRNLPGGGITSVDAFKSGVGVYFHFSFFVEFKPFSVQKGPFGLSNESVAQAVMSALSLPQSTVCMSFYLD